MKPAQPPARRPVLLTLIAISSQSQADLAERFESHYAPTDASRAAAIQAHGARIEVVFTNGSTGLRADEIDAMPKLTLACAQGAGHENIASAHARARGVVVANGAGTNDDCVADHAFALLLAVVRAVPRFDAACRQGIWRDALPLRPQLAGKRLGVLGLGAIGRKVARRGAAFDLELGYCTRHPVADVAYRHFGSATELAQWCDVLIVAVPGGAATRHLVDAAVLKALGPAGYLVNVARGSVVDTSALAQALRAGQLGGAGLDVYEGEPLPPAALLGLDDVVLSPHVAGTSPESKDAAMQCFFDNVQLHFSGKPVRTPV